MVEEAFVLVVKRIMILSTKSYPMEVALVLAFELSKVVASMDTCCCCCSMASLGILYNLDPSSCSPIAAITL